VIGVCDLSLEYDLIMMKVGWNMDSGVRATIDTVRHDVLSWMQETTSDNDDEQRQEVLNGGEERRARSRCLIHVHPRTTSGYKAPAAWFNPYPDGLAQSKDVEAVRILLLRLPEPQLRGRKGGGGMVCTTGTGSSGTRPRLNSAASEPSSRTFPFFDIFRKSRNFRLAYLREIEL